jgi:hypothetical protein
MATRWGIASAGMISHDFVNALSTFEVRSDHSGSKVKKRKWQWTCKNFLTFNKKFSERRKKKRQWERETERRGNGKTDIKTERQWDVETDRETERQRDRETEKQRDGETERPRDRETERQRDRETERQRGQEIERQRNREIFCIIAQYSISWNTVILNSMHSYKVHEFALMAFTDL